MICRKTCKNPHLTRVSQLEYEVFLETNNRLERAYICYGDLATYHICSDQIIAMIHAETEDSTEYYILKDLDDSTHYFKGGH